MLRCEGESHPNMVLTPMILQLPKPQRFWCSDTALLLQNTPGPTAVTGTDELDASELVLNMAHYDFIYPTLPWDAKEILSDVGVKDSTDMGLYQSLSLSSLLVWVFQVCPAVLGTI